MLIDSHCHIDDTVFDNDRVEVLERATAAGVVSVVVPAISLQRFAQLHQTCESLPGLYPAYGLHPLFFHEHGTEDINALELWLDLHPAIAIGECGLDKTVKENISGISFNRQLELFENQLSIAKKRKLPVIVHANKAVEEVIHVLKASQLNHGVVHSFNGSIEQARRLIDDGYLLGIGSAVTRADARRLHKMLKQLPLDSLLLETDAPFQAAASHRGNRNEPAFITEVATTVAHWQNVELSQVKSVTTKNALTLFALPNLLAPN